MIGYCQGQLDQYIPSFIKLAHQGMIKKEVLELRCHSLNVLAECAIYNPKHFCQIMSKFPTEVTKLTFNGWLSINDA